MFLVSALIGCTVTNTVIVPSEYLLPNERFLSVGPELAGQEIAECTQKAAKEVEPPQKERFLVPLGLTLGLVGLACQVEYGYAPHEHQHPPANGWLLITAGTVAVLMAIVVTVDYVRTSSRYKKEVASKVQQCVESLGYQLRN
jgi:hypothetical protein